MAINASSKQAEQLKSDAARIAGAASTAVAALGAAGAIIRMASGGLDSAAMGALACLAVVLGIVAVAGIQLVRQQVSAQPILLGFWLLTAVAAVTFGVAAGLGGTPAWWRLITSWPAAGVIGPILAVACVEAFLLARASADLSRLRYGTNVQFAVAAAIAVLLAVNIISQAKDTFYRKDVELLGQYGLSERTIKIVKGLDRPVRLTVMYSANDANRVSEDRRSRVLETLQEMRDLNPKIEVASANTDAERAAVLARVTEQSSGQAPGHVKLLVDFMGSSKKVIDQLRQEQAQWQQVAGSSYLDEWSAAAQIASNLKKIAADLDETRARTEKEMAGLPDYARLADDIKDGATSAQQNLTAIAKLLDRLGKIPTAVQKNAPAVVKDLDATLAAAKESIKILGAATADSADPNSATDLLKKFADALGAVADKAAKTAQKLDEVAGADNAPYIRKSRAWLVETGEKPVTIGGMTMVARNNISNLYAEIADAFKQEKLMADNLLAGGTKEFQAKTLKEFRPGTEEYITNLEQLNGAAKEALKSLAGLDGPTAKLLAKAEGGKYLESAIQPLTALLDQIQKLPALTNSSLATDITQDNIVLVEAAGKAEVVGFDQVWPAKARSMAAGLEGFDQRTYNGDSALSSRILSMTQKPYAQVLLTYVEAPQNPYMMAPPSGGPANYSELRRRLEQANLKVADWDLSKDMPAQDANSGVAPGTPIVLLLLPPPPPSPPMGRQQEPAGLGPVQIAKVRAAIDAGASAIFLAQYNFPSNRFAPPAPYGWNGYLQQDWGLAARNNDLIIPAERDETGRKFQFVPLRFEYLPLSTFTDQAIGKPLQGQRMLWSLLCPIVSEPNVPAGVEISPVLEVPADWTSTWATSDVERIVSQINAGAGSFLQPDYSRGDMPAPFSVAVAATRQGPHPARIAVMGVAASLQDSYLTERIPVINEKGGLTTYDAPRGDSDLVLNAAYWLCGKQEYIASGPVQVQPIRNIPPRTYHLLWAFCVLVLPAAVLAFGGMVLLSRRR